MSLPMDDHEVRQEDDTLFHDESDPNGAQIYSEHGEQTYNDFDEGDEEEEAYDDHDEDQKLGQHGQQSDGDITQEHIVNAMSSDLESVKYNYSDIVAQCFNSFESVLENMQEIAGAEERAVGLLMEQAERREAALVAQLEKSRKLKQRMAIRAGHK